jgi:hypothetical protein
MEGDSRNNSRGTKGHFPKIDALNSHVLSPTSIAAASATTPITFAVDIYKYQ